MYTTGIKVTPSPFQVETEVSIEAVKGDPFLFSSTVCHKVMSCKHMVIGDIKRSLLTSKYKWSGGHLTFGS